MEHAALLDPDLQRRFSRDGYVVIPGFLDSGRVSALDATYRRLGPAPGDVGRYCYFDFQSGDAGYKTAVDAELRALYADPLAAHFDRFRPYYGNYVMKWPTPDSWFGVHQDASFVDEREALSASIWCPTVDATVHNGAMWFFPGSHRIRSQPRAMNQRSFAFDDVMAEIEQRCGVVVEVQAGDAIVFDHRVVHWSYANRSESPRLAAVLGIVPEGADLLHCQISDDDRLDSYRVDDSFYIENDPFGTLLHAPIGGSLLASESLVVEKVTVAELDRWLRDHPVPADIDLAAASRELAASSAEAAEDVPSAADTGGRGAAGPRLSALAEAVSALPEAVPDLPEAVSDSEAVSEPHGPAVPPSRRWRDRLVPGRA